MDRIDPIVMSSNGPKFYDLTNRVDLESDRLSFEDICDLEPYLTNILYRSDPRIVELAGSIIVDEAGFRFERVLDEDQLSKICDIFFAHITDQVAVIEGINPGPYKIHHVLRFHRETGSQTIVPTFIQVGLFNTFQRALQVLALAHLDI